MKFRLLAFLIAWIALSVSFFVIDGLIYPLGFSIKLAISSTGLGFLGSLAVISAAWMKGN